MKQEVTLLTTKKSKNRKLTQSVFLFSLCSLFGIKVPDCDGIAARDKKAEIRIKSFFLWTKNYGSKRGEKKEEEKETLSVNFIN